ncbi:hypothetical protein OG216_45655 [Streptomycetaceae bacterium NBC_01309]
MPDPEVRLTVDGTQGPAPSRRRPSLLVVLLSVGLCGSAAALGGVLVFGGDKDGGEAGRCEAARKAVSGFRFEPPMLDDYPRFVTEGPTYTPEDPLAKPSVRSAGFDAVRHQGDLQAWRAGARVTANTVLGSPECFSAVEVGNARTWLDTLNGKP